MAVAKNWVVLLDLDILPYKAVQLSLGPGHLGHELALVCRNYLGHVRRQKKIVPHRRKIVPRKRLAVTGVCIVVRRQKKRSYPEIHTPHQPHLPVQYHTTAG